jgi:predicted hydrolase (HD superfamily)
VVFRLVIQLSSLSGYLDNGTIVERTEAGAIATEFTDSEALRCHMLAVDAEMRAYAPQLGCDADEWSLHIPIKID